MRFQINFALGIVALAPAVAQLQDLVPHALLKGLQLKQNLDSATKAIT